MRTKNRPRLRKKKPPEPFIPRGGLATLTDVARHTGLGLSTVSRVIRNKPTFSARTRDKVLAAAKELNYTPNRIAATLASTASKLVGIVVPSIGNAVIPEVLAGALAVLEERGLQPIIGATNFDPLQEERLIESLLSWRPRGLLLSGL